MKLPQISQPTYEIQILSSKEPIHYRPFLVKEQKIMMMAAESKEIDSVIRAIKQIIQNCVIENINVDELPLADLETLFINLRAKSIGEIMSLYFRCTNKVEVPPNQNSAMVMSNSGVPYKEYKDCDMVMEIPVNLMEVKQINTDTPKKIMINESVGVIMKYPSIDMIDKLMKSNDSSVIFTVVASCIEQVFDKESTWQSKDATPEEMLEFVMLLPSTPFEKLSEFVDKVPKSKYETKQKCTKCGYEHDFVLEGISDFFF